MDPLHPMYETVIDGTPAEAGGDPPAAAPDLAPAEATDGTSSPEAAPPTPADPYASLGLDPADLRDIAEMLPMLRQAINQPQPQPQQQAQQGPPELDPFDPASVQAYNDWRDQNLLARFEQMVSPLIGSHQEQVMSEAENRAMDILRDDAARNGDFIGGDQSLNAARQLADTLLPDMQARYGPGPRAAEQALYQAAQHIRGLEENIAKQAVERHTNQLSTLANATREPAAGATGAEAPGQYKDEMEALAAWQARNTG